MAQYCRYCINAEDYNGEGEDFLCFADAPCGNNGAGRFYKAAKAKRANHCKHFEGIDAVPTADVAPVRHGRWKKSKGNERPTENGFVHDDRYVCDCCGWGCCCETKLDFSFCPNCGAKMDGGEQK